MALGWYFLALASELITEGQAEPSVRAECGGQCKPQERQYPTAGWDNLLQVGAVSQSTVIPCMKHCRSGFCSFPSALRADSSEEFCASHTSLRISWLCKSLCAGGDDLQQRGASPPWVGYWDFPAHSGRNLSAACVVGPYLLWMHQQCVHSSLRAGFALLHCAGLSDTQWNLWLMQKILIIFQTHPVGREKSTNGEKYDLIWQSLSCDWFIFCGATWPCPELQQKEICLAIRELLKMCLFVVTQVGKPLDPIQQVGMTQLPAGLVTLPQNIQYVTQGLILFG